MTLIGPSVGKRPRTGSVESRTGPHVLSCLPKDVFTRADYVKYTIMSGYGFTRGCGGLLAGGRCLWAVPMNSLSFRRVMTEPRNVLLSGTALLSCTRLILCNSKQVIIGYRRVVYYDGHSKSNMFRDLAVLNIRSMLRHTSRASAGISPYMRDHPAQDVSKLRRCCVVKPPSIRICDLPRRSCAPSRTTSSRR